MEQIALIGLGIMGQGMGQNLRKAGYPLTVYNRTADKTTDLAQAGATVAASPRAAAANAEVVVVMVANDDASRAVWQGPDGVLAGVQRGTVLVDSSTLSPGWVRELAGLAAAQGCPFLDAPVSGSKPQAAAGELGFFVGGDSATVARMQPIFAVLGQKVTHLGPIGSGATMKLVNNLMGGVQVAVLAEGLALAERAGLPMDQVAELLTNGAPASPIVKGKLGRMVAHDFEPHFALRWMHKDLSYAAAEGAHFGVPMDTVTAAQAIYARAMAQGLADQDFGAVIEAVRSAHGEPGAA